MPATALPDHTNYIRPVRLKKALMRRLLDA